MTSLEFALLILAIPVAYVGYLTYRFLKDLNSLEGLGDFDFGDDDDG